MSKYLLLFSLSTLIIEDLIILVETAKTSFYQSFPVAFLHIRIHLGQLVIFICLQSSVEKSDINCDKYLIVLLTSTQFYFFRVENNFAVLMKRKKINVFILTFIVKGKTAGGNHCGKQIFYINI